MAGRRGIRFDRYVLAGVGEDTNYESLQEVRETHGRTVLFSSAKVIIVRRKMEGGYVGDVLIYTEAA